MKIRAVRGDIAKVEVDAVVNSEEPAAELMGKAGEEVESEATARGPLKVGDVMMTTGGRLRCKYVIHAPTGEATDAGAAESVEKSTLAALRCAATSGLRSVAIPAFREGESTETATQALLKALRDFDEDNELEEVFIVGKKGQVVRALKKQIGSGN